MNGRGIERHLGIWFAIALAVLVASAGLSYRNARRIEENNQWVIHTHEVLGVLEETQTALLEAEFEARQRGDLISGDERHPERYREGVDRLPRLVARVRALTVDNPAQQRRIDRVGQYVTERLDVLHGNFNLRKEGKLDASGSIVRTRQGRVLMDQVRGLIGEMWAEETRLLELRDVASRAAVRTTIVTIAFASLIAIVLLVMVFGLFHRDLRQRCDAEQVLRKKIGERTQVETELRKSEERFRGLLEFAPDAIVIASADGRIALVNSQTETIFGYEREELLGQFVEILIPERFRGSHVGHRTSYSADPHTRPMGASLNLSARRKDGSEFPVEISLSPLKAQDELLITSVIRDITARRQAEEELMDYATRLQRSNRELQEFASVASHDLQEPLRKIQAFADRLQTKLAGIPGGLGRDDLARMHSAATRMRRLIDDLLNFSRVTIKANPFTPVDLGQVAREVVSDLEDQIQQTGARVDLGELPIIDADPTQMRQLLQNLIGNALKFHRADPPPVVAVRAELSPIPASRTATCQIIVRDNGIGFDEKYLDRIFQVFERLHARNDYEGTGMGLAICRKIVEWHGGTITARSTPGQGATFIVSMPVGHTIPENAT